MVSKKIKVSLSNPDSYKHLPTNPDLVSNKKVLYGEFKTRCKTKRNPQTTKCYPKGAFIERYKKFYSVV